MGNGLRTQARRVLLHQIAPKYHQASGSQKQHILEEFVTTTGYARKYAQWLLNHAEEVFAPPVVLRRRYGPEVEEALVLVWKTLNRICAKRFIPFLPVILETLEEHGHVQLSKEHRSQLLSMSAATAERLLQAHRYTHPHGLSWVGSRRSYRRLGMQDSSSGPQICCSPASRVYYTVSLVPTRPRLGSPPH